jgi:hypothetical protein
MELLIEELNGLLEEDEGLMLPDDVLFPLEKSMLCYLVLVRLVHSKDMTSGACQGRVVTVMTMTAVLGVITGAHAQDWRIVPMVGTLWMVTWMDIGVTRARVTDMAGVEIVAASVIGSVMTGVARVVTGVVRMAGGMSETSGLCLAAGVPPRGL